MLLLKIKKPHLGCSMPAWSLSEYFAFGGYRHNAGRGDSQNHLARFEVGALCSGEAKEFAEYVVLVLTEFRRQPPDADVVRLRESCRRADRNAWRKVGGTDFGGRTPRAQVRVARDVLHVPRNVRPYACALQPSSRRVGIPLPARCATIPANPCCPAHSPKTH